MTNYRETPKADMPECFIESIGLSEMTGIRQRG